MLLISGNAIQNFILSLPNFGWAFTCPCHADKATLIIMQML